MSQPSSEYRGLYTGSSREYDHRQIASSRGATGANVPIRTGSSTLSTAGNGKINTQSTVGRQTVDFLAKALQEEQEQRRQKEKILEQLLAEESVS